MEELELTVLVIWDKLANPLLVCFMDITASYLPPKVGPGFVSEEMPFVCAEELESTCMSGTHLQLYQWVRYEYAS